MTNAGISFANILQPSAVAQVTIVPDKIDRIGMVVVGAVGQTAHLQEWQDSAGAVKSWVAQDGSSSFTSSGIVKILSTVVGVDAKAVATTALYTVPTGKTCVVTAAIIRCTAATAVTIGPQLGIGIAAGEDDIFASTTLTSLTSASKCFGFSSVGTSVIGASTNVIKLGVDVATTGTSQTLAVDLMGYIF